MAVTALLFGLVASGGLGLMVRVFRLTSGI